MENILTDIVKESHFLTGLKELFKDYIDIYIALFIIMFCVGFIHNNFDIKNKVLNRIVVYVYHKRNYIYLFFTIVSVFLITCEITYLKDFFSKKDGLDWFLIFICGISSIVNLFLSKVFIPKNNKKDNNEG